ncbi:MAG TPA: type II toxin-antitoxin system RelE/ParE family toxin [Aurantimonas coralicida]|uniref:Type II toxin-antitoxin system RelE/ParE family toxin n=2 Tax=root TaxID=1 RepID=A0A9C9NIW4_9HYPH|nr:type II toxin-antitoxin system RelE/ParE family toxin [Aurantimonas coralicida]HEU02173.1 type II toxin-antitoxin system RelE/ParE family toxin [Aurantimonas coralicida]
MAERWIVRRPRAEADLIEIWLHIALDSPLAADRQIDRIGERILGLARFPEMGVARPDIAEGVRVLSIPPFLVLFQVDSDKVEIVRIVHGARDLPSIDLS